MQPTHWQGSCSPPPFNEGLLTAALAAAAVAVTEAGCWTGCSGATGAGAAATWGPAG